MKKFEIIVDLESKNIQRYGDCDCACSEICNTNTKGDFLENLEINPNEYLHRANDLITVPLSEEHFIVISSKYASARAAINTVTMDVLNYFSTPQQIQSIYEVLDSLSVYELNRAISYLRKLSFLMPYGNISPHENEVSKGTLVAWLHSTNACNLRCTYCFLVKTPDKMSVEIGKKSIDTVMRSACLHGFKHVKLKFAGGEATLNFSLVRILQYYAKEQAALSGLDLQSVILSNGVFISEQLIDFLEASDVDLMISLDGIGEFHDRQRKFINGRGSFDQVATNIERLLRRNIRPFISITISNENAIGLPEVVEYVLNRDLPFSLNFYRENECSASIESLRYGDRQLIDMMNAAFAVIERNLPHRSLLGTILDLTNLSAPHHKTCGVGQNYLVIDQLGHIAKCHMEIEKSITSIHVEDPLQVIIEDKTGIQNISVHDKAGCRDCSWRYWCAGGCPLVTYRATGRYDVKSPNCNIYKALLPEVLRLEGTRLLKYGQVI